MKKIILLALTIFAASTTFSQTFEGEIIYQNTFKSKVPNMTNQQLTSMMGSEQDYYIKKGNYKSVANGTFIQWQLYINADNKLYNKMSNSETILWNDGSVNPDEVMNTVFNKGVTEILGYRCDELILTCKSGTQKYYFNTKLAIDSRLYANHKFGNWYEYLSKANALPLKTIIETAQFTMETVATEIKPMKLDDNLFQLPGGAKTAKSPY